MRLIGTVPLTGVAPGATQTRAALGAPPVDVRATRAASIQAADGAKLVALTFDDGPAPITDRFLDVLAGRQVVGTFFMVGQSVAARPGVVRRMHAEGHEVGNHSWDHSSLQAGGEAARVQLQRTSDAIEAAVGVRPTQFRPPYGATSRSLRDIAAAQGMAQILWDVDPQDWRRPGADAIYRAVVGAVRPGSVVLMHDAGGDRTQTLAALPRIIDTLREQGYSFVTVSQLRETQPPAASPSTAGARRIAAWPPPRELSST